MIKVGSINILPGSVNRMKKPEVTILVPHYKTLELTKLCLRLIRKHTSADLARVIVIDNASQDESTDYLRQLRWITLLEREVIVNEGAISAHSRALDLGLAQVDTPYVLSIHTDTLVKHPEWLNYLLKEIKHSENIAGVGSWKLELKSPWQRIAKRIEHQVQHFAATCLRKQKKEQEIYLRSHCALYRTDLLQRYQLTFSQNNWVACRGIHQKLTELGFELVFLPSEKLIQFIDHINHATTVLNPELSRQQKSVTRGLKRIGQNLSKLGAKDILSDNSLDF